MAATWSTHLLLPSALAGAGRAIADIAPAVPDEVRALIGTVRAVDQNDPTCFRVTLPLDTLDQLFWGGPIGTGLVVSWFAKIAGVWEAGPVDMGLNLSNRYQNLRFSWPKAWFITVMQSIAKSIPPFPSKAVKILGAFPRNPDTWPAITIQVDEGSHQDGNVGDSMQGAVSVGDTEINVRHKQLRASFIGWCQTPEDRDDLTVWLGSALQIVCHQATFYGLEEPTFGVTESEDMEGAGTGVPIYIVVGTLSASRWSSMEIPLINGVGPLTVPRGSAALANSNQLSFP